jgi:hypothetical protein
MALRLDDRYVLLEERPLRWLPRAYDAWDTELDEPVTVGWLPAGDSIPLLPAAERLKHPNIIQLRSLREEPGSGYWVVWDYFGAAGADILDQVATGPGAVAWIAHETTGALSYAREALGRPGGFRLSDFGADMIRLFPDGQVKVVGFGRIATELTSATEFATLGESVGHWLAHSMDSVAADEDATVAANLVDTLSRFADADLHPHSSVPRITAGLRDHLEGGEGELANWVAAIGAAEATSRVGELYRSFVDGGEEPSAEVHTVPIEAADSGADLPRVRIAPTVREPETGQPKTRKGLPIKARRRLPIILAGAVILLILFGGWRLRGGSPAWLGGAGSHQVVLETMPPGASVFLNDTLLLGKTPLALDNIATGWHSVQFSKSGFPTITDSILVYKLTSHRPFHFVFTRVLILESRPPGAIVYLNGRRAPRPTPYLETEWPATQMLSLVMHLERYGSLEDCVLDPTFGTLEVKDAAAWNVAPHGDTLSIRGQFAASLAFFASPPDCRIIIDDTLDVDPTGGTSYALTYGNHRMRAQAVGFDAADSTIVVSGQTPPILPVVLTRPVRINAFDSRDPDKDLRVLVDRLEGPERTLLVRRFTPYSVRIPAVAHTVTLRKRDYLDTTIYIPPDITRVAVAMTPVSRGRGYVPPSYIKNDPDRFREPQETTRTTARSAPWINVRVELAGDKNLAGAEIWARNVGLATEEWLGATDASGELRVQITAGNYDLLAYLDAYSGVRKRVKVRPARNRPIVIELNR